MSQSATSLRSAIEIVTVSAKTPAALAALCGRYAQFLREHPETRLSDFAYTANACRSQFHHRVAVVANSAAGAAEQLEQTIQGNLEQSPVLPVREQAIRRLPSRFCLPARVLSIPGWDAPSYQQNAVFRSAIERVIGRSPASRSTRSRPFCFGAPGSTARADRRHGVDPAGALCL